MSAPPYTLRSFLAVAERENRRGRDISRLDPHVGQATRALQERREAFRQEIARYERDDPARASIRKEYWKARQELRQRRSEAVESAVHRALLSFEQKLERGTFTFSLKPGPIVAAKQTYFVRPTLDILFPAKQAAEAIKRAASLDAPSRNSIVRALKSTLEKSYTHAIYKMDIQNFFESIPHATLIDRINQHSNLDGVSAQLARQLLTEYQAITDENAGVPRGVGLSSQLAELYMNGLDLIVKTHPGVLFYARYVDDVVVVVENDQALEVVQHVITDELQNMGLEINRTKTHGLKTNELGDYYDANGVEYLGYRFVRDEGRLTTGLTNKRKGRRQKRLNLALEEWLRKNPIATHPNHGNDGMLVDRVRYLAGNTRLLNSKSSVAIGLFHSNSALDPDAPELAELDNILQTFLQENDFRMADKVKSRLESISFVKMFTSRPFLRFRQRRLEQITRIWQEAGI